MGWIRGASYLTGVEKAMSGMLPLSYVSLAGLEELVWMSWL